jgi:hypothetical protein
VPILTLHERLLIEAMNVRQARFMIAGSLADAVHGVDLIHGDLDLYVGSDPDNLTAVLLAVDDVDPQPFRRTLGQGSMRYKQFTVPLGSRTGDLLTDLAGLDFDSSWNARLIASIDGLDSGVLSVKDRISHLRLSTRSKDRLRLCALLEIFT